MNVFVQSSTVLLPTVYLLAAVLFGMSFAGEEQPSFAPRLRRPVLLGALGLHASMFLARAQVAGTFPIDGAWLTLSATALTVAALFAVVTWRLKVASVGGIVLAMVSMLQAAASALGPVRAEALPPADGTTIAHVLTIALAAAALVLSGVFGFLHLLQLRQMKRKSFGPLYRELPDLEQLARMTRTTALWGFLFMAVGLNAGIGMAHARGIEGFGYLDPSVLMTIAIWLHFGVIAFSRRIPGFTARRASIAATIGLAVLLLTIVITLLPVSFHDLG